LVNIPIKAPQDYQPFTVLVDKILESKKLNPKANTSDFEKQIDELVYELYGLTEQEIKIIESK
jgi:adenine-specific DNA-methyltransferase